MESKRERFVRLAEARTNKILKMIELLGNLSNKSSYEYTEEDIQLIYKRIMDELNVSRERFGFYIRKKADTFTLDKDNVLKGSNVDEVKMIDVKSVDL